MTNIIEAIEKVGGSGVSAVRKVSEVTSLYLQTVGSFIRMGRRDYVSSQRQIVSQILFTGVEALPLIATVAMLCGVTIVFQATTNMPKFGAGEFFGKIMIMVVVRELGPLITSIVVIGRSGSALAAYIGSMRVTKEVSALEVIGINPVQFIVMPAFMGMVVSMVALGIYFDFVAIVGGLLVASLIANVPFWGFVAKVVDALTMADILLTIFKNIIFGSVVAVVSCYHGLEVRNERDVPKAARRSVVWSMVIAMLINVIITYIIITLGFYG
ncbi:MAG: hypothetical protein GF401_15935 [Chitinivibrionales bacterium]|nr:hypothetical protein [Chitinivibrionales bacterium]